MTDLEWKRALRDFDPLRVLGIEEIASLYATRPDSPAVRILEELRDATDATEVRVLVAGARGAGKTTELRRLHATLVPDDAPALPLYLDLAGSLPPDATTRRWLPLLAVAVEALTEGWRKPESALSGLMPAESIARIRAWVASTAMRWSPVAATAGAVIGGSVSEGSPGAAQVGTAVGARMAEEVVAVLNQLKLEDASIESLISGMHRDLTFVRQRAGRPVVLLLDGLDKRASVDSVLKALDEAELLYRLPAALVVSGPMELSLDPRFAARQFPGHFRSVVLHNLPVVWPNGDSKPAGTSVMVDLFDRRWRAALLVPSPLEEPLLREAARWSSGIVREFLEIVRLTLKSVRRSGRSRGTDTDLAEAVRERRLHYTRTVPRETWDELAHVLATRERPRSALDDLLFTNQVACYPNDDAWFRPNEVLVPHLRERVGAGGSE